MSQTAALRLIEAEKSKEFCTPVRELIGETDLAAAYATQEIITQHRLEQGARIVGQKIGLTSIAVQKQLGVDQPDFGILFADMDVMNGGTIPWAETSQPKVEAEIAFVLKKDLPHADSTAAEVIQAIDYAVAAIEVVGSRIQNWDIRITDTIADNASSSHFVLGHDKRSLDQVDLLNCAMTLSLNGEEVSTGVGRNCLGSPINSTVWLAGKMAAHGRPLKAGDVILTGALGAMAPVKPGDHAVAFVEGFGEVSVKFGADNE